MNTHPTAMPLVSIVVPMYRGERYLREALDSIRAQTYELLDIICIDDGSPDDCWRIVSEYRKRDTRFRLIRQDNQGLSESRNRGVAEAAGEFVLFVDQDDGIRPDTVNTLVSLATKENLDAVVFGYIEGPQDTVLGDLIWPEDPAESLDFLVTPGLERLVEGFLGDWWEPRSQLLFLRKEFMSSHDLRFFPGILHEDNLFTLTVLLRVARLVALDTRLSFVRQTSGSMTRASTTWHHVWSLIVTLGEGIDQYRRVRSSLSLRERFATKYVLHNVLNQAVDAAKRIPDSERDVLGESLNELRGYSARVARNRFWLSSNPLFGWITKGIRHWSWKFLRLIFR